MKVGIRTATLRSTAQVADITVDRLDELAPMLQATDGIARRQLIGNDLSFPRAKAG
jgi:hypothetical protein